MQHVGVGKWEIFCEGFYVQNVPHHLFKGNRNCTLSLLKWKVLLNTWNRIPVVHAGRVMKYCFFTECISFSTVLSWIIWYSLCWQKSLMNYCYRLPETQSPNLLGVGGQHTADAIAQKLGCTHLNQGAWWGNMPDTWFFAAIPLKKSIQLYFKPEINCYKRFTTSEKWTGRQNWAAFPTRKKLPTHTDMGIRASRGKTLPVLYIGFHLYFNYL